MILCKIVLTREALVKFLLKPHLFWNYIAVRRKMLSKSVTIKVSIIKKLLFFYVNLSIHKKSSDFLVKTKLLTVSNPNIMLLTRVINSFNRN